MSEGLKSRFSHLRTVIWVQEAWGLLNNCRTVRDKCSFGGCAVFNWTWTEGVPREWMVTSNTHDKSPVSEGVSSQLPWREDTSPLFPEESRLSLLSWHPGPSGALRVSGWEKVIQAQVEDLSGFHLTGFCCCVYSLGAASWKPGEKSKRNAVNSTCLKISVGCPRIFRLMGTLLNPSHMAAKWVWSSLKDRFHS